MSILSQRLREARSRMRPRVTQRDVAKQLSRSPSAVNLWEKGTSEPNAEQLVILARWFGVTTDWLLGMDAKKSGITACERCDKQNPFDIHTCTPKQDWDEVEALRASLREHMAEIHRLREAGRQALNALEAHADFGIKSDKAITALRAALEPVTDCHDLEQARAVAISNLLTHFGIPSANSDVNVDYLHKLLGDFLVASIGCNKEGGNLPPPFDRSANPGKTSGHIPDAGKMVATVKQSLIVEPTKRNPLMDCEEAGHDEGRCGNASCIPRPKRKPLTDAEIREIWATDGYRSNVCMKFARALERAHGIGGEE